MMKGKRSPYLARRGNKLKKVKKDYQCKKMNNPFFRQRQKQKVKRGQGRYCLILALIAVTIIGLMYLFFMSPVFALRNVRVDGISRMAPQEIEARVWQQSQTRRFWPFKQSNLIFFKTEDIKKTLLENYSFDSLNVYKKWPHSLVISANERKFSFIWRDKNGQNFSDSQGCIIREAAVSPSDLTAYPILETADNQERLDDDDCLKLDESYLRSMFVLSDKLKAYPELKVDRFLLEGEANTLKADLNLGPNILFNVKEDADKQVNKLIIIKQDKPASEFNGLEYIDLRYGDRAYFK